MSIFKRPRRAGWLCLSLTGGLFALPCRANPAPMGKESDPQESKEDEARAAPSGTPDLIGYQTEPGHRLPILMYPTYQSARRLWTAGFSTTMGGLAVLGTGVGVLLVGSYATDSFTDTGHKNALIAGGVLTGIGAAGVIAGSVLWHFGRRDLNNLENRLPNKDGILSPSSIIPSVSVIPDGGGFRLNAGLAGRFW